MNHKFHKRMQMTQKYKMKAILVVLKEPQQYRSTDSRDEDIPTCLPDTTPNLA